MSAAYEIVKYDASYKRRVVELQKHLWSSSTRLNARYLEWKYERNPYARESVIYLALDGREVIGMRGFHGGRLQAGTPSRSFPVLIGDDAVISPAYRNRSLVSRIMKAAYSDLGKRDGYLVSLGGASRINAFGLMTLGWKSVGGMRPIGRIAANANAPDLRRIAARMPWLWRYADARILAGADRRKPFRHLDVAALRQRRPAERPVAVERKPRIDAMVDLIDRLGHDGRVRQVRDRGYLAWRFQNPLSDFRYLYWEDARLEGYLVLCRRTSDLGGWDRVYISDFEARSARVRAGLLTAAIEWGGFPELVTWSASLSTETSRALTDQGFVPVDLDESARGCPCVLVRSLADGAPDTDWKLGDRRLLDAANWDVRVLDSMRA